MTQYETSARLLREGRTAAEIANTIGITELMVKRRLPLGNLLPRIRDASRDEEIDEDTIRYLSLASKRQQQEWLGLFKDPEQYAPRAWHLKEWLFGGQEISTEVALFPLDDYKGPIIADLLAERSYFADADQFWTLQNQAIAAKRDAHLKDGWAEVELVEPGERFQSREHEKTPKNDGGRVYITLSDRGDVEVHEGYLTTKEARKRRKAETQSKGDAEAGVAPGRPEITKAMQNYLELHRHAAVRVELMNHVDVPLRLMVAHAIGGSALWSVTPELQLAADEAIVEGVAKSKAQAVFDEQRKAVLRILGLGRHGDAVTCGIGDDDQTARLFAKRLVLSDSNATAAGKTQKKIIRDCLAGENNRTKVEGWLPGYMAFPLKPYPKTAVSRSTTLGAA